MIQIVDTLVDALSTYFTCTVSDPIKELIHSEDNTQAKKLPENPIPHFSLIKNYRELDANASPEGANRALRRIESVRDYYVGDLDTCHKSSQMH